MLIFLEDRRLSVTIVLVVLSRWNLKGRECVWKERINVSVLQVAFEVLVGYPGREAQSGVGCAGLVLRTCSGLAASDVAGPLWYQGIWG